MVTIVRFIANEPPKSPWPWPDLPIPEEWKYHDPINTPRNPLFDSELLENIKELNASIKAVVDFFKNCWHYITHPYELLTLIINLLSKSSYFLCMMVCMWCIILYVLTEDEKFKKWGIVSFLIYVVTQLLKWCL